MLVGYGYYSKDNGRLRFTDGTCFRNLAYETYVTSEGFGVFQSRMECF